MTDSKDDWEYDNGREAMAMEVLEIVNGSQLIEETLTKIILRCKEVVTDLQ